MSAKRRLFFLDVETTGLDVSIHELLQVGAILTGPDGRDTIERYAARLRPLRPELITPETAEINGFRPEDYTDATCSPRAEVAGHLYRMARGAILIGYNLRFDVPFTVGFLREQRLRPSWHHYWIDVLSLAWPYLQAGAIPYLKLDCLCDYFAVARPQVHTAEADVLATQQVYLALMDKLMQATTLAPRPASGDDEHWKQVFGF